MVKNQKGFTLVEVIVVAVIVAVLAAVAIPLYNGYIKDSRQNVCNNTAGTVASACAATKQQNVANVPVGGPYAAGASITFNGESGTPNNIMVPPDYTVTIGASNATCTSTKDASVTATFNYQSVFKKLESTYTYLMPGCASSVYPGFFKKEKL